MNYPLLQMIVSCLSTIFVVTYFIKTQKFITFLREQIQKERSSTVDLYEKMRENRDFYSKQLDANRECYEQLQKIREREREEGWQCSCHKIRCRFFGKDKHD